MKRAGRIYRRAATSQARTPSGPPLRRTKLRPISTKATQVKRLDALCRELTFKRDGNLCQHCGRGSHIQWCHIRSRRYHTTRWRLQNVLTLCAGCHLWGHHNPHEFIAWFNEKYPDRANLLKLWSRGGKVDMAGTRLWLEQELAKCG